MTTSKPLLIREMRAHLALQYSVLQSHGIVEYARWHQRMMTAWLKNAGGRHAYRELTESQLRATRRSDTVFVFGSGYSLNDITQAEWAHVAKHDTLGFTKFIFQNWVPVRYHLIRGAIESMDGSRNIVAYAEHYAKALRENQRFDDAILILQGEYLAQFANTLVGWNLLPKGARTFRFHTARSDGLPSREFGSGLRHAAGTLSDAVNFAYAMGWKEVVLTGVDLYDSRYFWLPPDRTENPRIWAGDHAPSVYGDRGIRFDQNHSTIANGIIGIMDAWSRKMAADGVRLSVYNPRSLLAQVLPLYEKPAAPLEPRPA